MDNDNKDSRLKSSKSIQDQVIGGAEKASILVGIIYAVPIVLLALFSLPLILLFIGMNGKNILENIIWVILRKDRPLIEYSTE